jgi:hypothetical protein
MIARIILFGSSYVPLFAIFAIRFQQTTWIWASIAVVFTILAAALFVVVFTRHQPQIYHVRSVQDSGAAVAGYVATYLLPFATVNEPSGRDLIGYGVFFLVVGALYTRSTLLGVNPLIYLTPWQIYEVQTTAGRSLLVLAKVRPSAGESITASTAVASIVVRKDENC